MQEEKNKWNYANRYTMEVRGMCVISSTIAKPRWEINQRWQVVCDGK